MRSVVGQFPRAITIFIHPGSMEELENRLRQRGTESESSIQRRLQVAEQEMMVKAEYRFEVVNDDVQRAVDEICGILRSQ